MRTYIKIRKHARRARLIEMLGGWAERRTPLRAPSCERDGWKRLAHRVTYPVP
jgi:hypothetical protein